MLAWYFAQVVPWSEFGKPRPWYFLPLLPSTYALVVPPAKVEDGDESLLEGCPSDAYEERTGGEPVGRTRFDQNLRRIPSREWRVL